MEWRICRSEVRIDSDMAIDISARELTKSYGTDLILSRVSFHVNRGDRIGIIGINGAGKTTLLNILAGQLDPDDGEIFIADRKKIGYLRQDAGLDSDNTVIEQVRAVFDHFPEMEVEMEELLAKATAGGKDSERYLERYQQLHDRYEWMGGYAYESEIRGILTSMAFGEDAYDKKISSLSGGEKTRLALALLLLEKPDILFLDEPTNHLDIGTLRWLEQYLKTYRGTIILVSHDRYFLDSTVNRIFEISDHRLTIYEGNYRIYAEKRRELRQTQARLYEKQQREIARQEEMIRRFKQHGTEKLAKRARSREKMLDAMERVDRPEAEGGKMKISFHQNYRSGSDVLKAVDLGAGFGYGRERRELFEGVSLDVKRGERVCIVGDNGTGKTTLLRVLVGELTPTAGRLKQGHNVQIAYYDQGQQSLDPDSTVIDELHDTYHLYTEGELRNMLGRFLFSGDQVFMKVGDLSGGERARLALLKLMMSGANLLILDEPTNHLDVESKEVFEEALLEYPGTCIIVSHDRYFLNRIPTRITELTPHGLLNFLGRYDYYIEKKQQMISSGRQYLQEMGRAAGEAGKVGKTGKEGERSLADAADASKGGPDGSGLSSAERRKLQKEKEAEERRRKRMKETLEAEIAEREEEIGMINEQLTREDVMRDHEELGRLAKRLDELRSEVDERMKSWLELEE